MRRLLVLVILVLVVGGGTYYFLNRDRIKSAGDLWDVAREHFAGLTQSPEATSFKPPVSRSGDTIRIASFNVQVLGPTKLGKAHVMDILCRIVRRFDIVAIQEIRSQDQSILPTFIDMINQTGRHYDYVIGPRLGRTHSKEQYAFIFDRASVEVDRNQLYTLSDPDDLFHREPLIAWFRVRGPAEDEAFTFSVVNIHTDPDEAVEEVEMLPEVIRLVREDGRQEDDVILAGDLNVGDRDLGPISMTPNLRWVISHLPTNTRGTQQYDNLIYHEQATSEFTGRGGVFDFFSQFNMTMQEALEVSDHLPVWAEFSIYEGGTPGHLAESSSPAETAQRDTNPPAANR